MSRMSGRSTSGFEHVGAAAAGRSPGRSGARSSVGTFCRVSTSTVGRWRAAIGDPPGLGGLVGVAGPDDEQVRDGAQRGIVLDRLVRRTVLADADAVVREDADGARARSARRGGSADACSRRRRGRSRRTG